MSHPNAKLRCMRKFTAAEVLAAEPDLTPEEVAEVVQVLNEEPVPMFVRWALEDDDLARSTLNPPKIGPDGLTGVMRSVNEWAEAQGLPIPFPPRKWEKNDDR